MARKVHELATVHPTKSRLTQKVRDRYSDWSWYYHRGYITYFWGKIRLPEHRLVAKERYGDIPSELDVHHIDGNPINNDASNLVVLTHGEHSKLHPPAIKGRRTHHEPNCVCEKCGKRFYVPPSHKARNRRFGGRASRVAEQRIGKASRPARWRQQ